MTSPRLSIEKIVQNRGDPINVSTVQNIGAASQRTAITVSSTAQQILIGAGKKTIELLVIGSKDIYYGGSTVSSANGLPIYSGNGKIWANVKDDFSVWLVTTNPDTSEVRIVEYS